jgi:hypothetical protein
MVLWKPKNLLGSGWVHKAKCVPGTHPSDQDQDHVMHSKTVFRACWLVWSLCKLYHPLPSRDLVSVHPHFYFFAPPLYQIARSQMQSQRRSQRSKQVHSTRVNQQPIPVMHASQPSHYLLYQRLQYLIASAPSVTVVCGAGISTSAGIPVRVPNMICLAWPH